MSTSARGTTAAAGGDESWYEAEESWYDEGAYEGYDAGAGYYDGYVGDDAGGYDHMYEHIKVDFYSMVFSLDAKLDPEDLYVGLDLDEKSLVLTIELEDVEDQAPSAWKSRPLRIHPEPSELPKLTSTPIPVAVSSAQAPRVEIAVKVDATTPVTLALTPQATEADSAAGDPAPSSTGALAGTSSPKIVISNSQLEHLMQKMQALKQGRKSGLAPASEERQEEQRQPPPPPQAEVPRAELSRAAAPPRRTAPALARTTLTNCPGGHGLRLFRTPEAGWWCSVCESEHPKNASFFGCRTCDYDVCEGCARRTTAAARGDEASRNPEDAGARPRESAAHPAATPRREQKSSGRRLPPTEKHRKDAGTVVEASGTRQKHGEGKEDRALRARTVDLPPAAVQRKAEVKTAKEVRPAKPLRTAADVREGRKDRKIIARSAARQHGRGPRAERDGEDRESHGDDRGERARATERGKARAERRGSRVGTDVLSGESAEHKKAPAEAGAKPAKRARMRAAPVRRDKERSESEESPPKKRAPASRAAEKERAKSPRSKRPTLAPADEAARIGRAAADASGGSGSLRRPRESDDLLRRVLRAAGGQAKRKGSDGRTVFTAKEQHPHESGDGAPRPNGTGVGAALKPAAPGRAALVGAGPPQGIRRTFEDFAGRAERKSRRV